MDGNGAGQRLIVMAVSTASSHFWKDDSPLNRNLELAQRSQRYVQHHSGHRHHFASVRLSGVFVFSAIVLQNDDRHALRFLEFCCFG